MNGVTTNYIYDGELLIAEYTATKTIVYIYDALGSPIGFKCRTSTYDEDVWDMYYYEKNLQGDILAIYNTSGTKLISYKYNAWGVTTKSYANGGASTTATYNNLTYRGYYYDSNLSMYYLQSRYYDPVVCRFISPDAIGYLGANEDLTSYNLYAYCSNNPINNVDPTGNFAISTAILVGAIVGLVSGFVGTMIADYADDGEAFNGSIGADDYAVNSLVTAAAGAVIGAVSPVITDFVATKFASGGLALASCGAVSITASSTVLVAGVSTMVGVSLFANRSKKDMSTDKPSWVDQSMVDYNKTPQQNATDILNNKKGVGNWKKGPGSEFNKIVKWIARKLFYGG